MMRTTAMCIVRGLKCPAWPNDAVRFFDCFSPNTSDLHLKSVMLQNFDQLKAIQIEQQRNITVYNTIP